MRLVDVQLCSYQTVKKKQYGLRQTNTLKIDEGI